MIYLKRLFTVSAAAALWLCNGGVSTTHVNLVATAGAVVGAPVTPISYAGVARRSTGVTPAPGVGAPGVGVTPGVGVGAPGVGATPVPGVGTPTNRGGPVNRVGVR
jgi:hypothetical protein